MSRVMRYDRTCRCPQCRTRLAGLRCDVTRCPRCRSPLPPHEVWRNRKYAGVIELSPVVAALLAVVGLAATLGLVVAIAAKVNGASSGLAVVAAGGIGVVGFLCLALGVMRWQRHRGASADEWVW